MVEGDLYVGDASLHTVNRLPVRSADSIRFDGVDLVDEAVRLIGQLTNDVVPLSKALVAGAAVGEGPREPAGADVTAWTRNAVHTDTVTAAFVTLLL